MRTKLYLSFAILLCLSVGSHTSPVHAQNEETWLSAEGGLIQQELRPMHLNAPVYQTHRGWNTGIALYYELESAYHRGAINYHAQNEATLLPPDIPASPDSYVSLELNYQYTRFHFKNIADLHLDFGSGPYLSIRDQTIHFPSGSGPSIALGSLLYGGGLNLTLRYHHPDIPLATSFHFINGGFLGDEEANRRSERYRSSPINGWLTNVKLHVNYQLLADWQVTLNYNWSERIEYRESISQRRTFQNVNAGIRYRLEDD